MERLCLTCNKPLTSPVWKKNKYCSMQCFGKANRPKGTPSWNKGKTGTHFSKSTEFKNRERKFKGTEYEYKRIHYLVAKAFGRPVCCEECGKIKDNPRSIHWANLNGDYSINRDNWKMLCVKCHFVHDKQYLRIKEAAYIQCVTLQKLLDFIGRVDVIKCDIEGSEYEIFEGTDLSGVIYIAIEFHAWTEPGQLPIEGLGVRTGQYPKDGIDRLITWLERTHIVECNDDKKSGGYIYAKLK